jgi:outer membrane cobalamin receptor
MQRIVLHLFGLVLLTASAAVAQTGDIRGVVVDSVTGEKIPYASIVVLNTPRGASTNLSGFFLIGGLPEGSFELAVSSIGYVRQVRRIFIRRGDALNLTFHLTPEAVALGEVVVTQRASREMKEIQTSVQVLDQNDLKLVPVTVQEDVFRSIAILPGIVSTSDVSAQFYVRGGAGDQNLILLDGMRIYNPYHALGIFSIFDSDAIQTTEVYTGAFPPGYGGRLSSVVNLTTRDGRTSSIAGRANLNLLSGKVQLEGPLGEHARFFVNGRKSLSHSTFDRFLQQDAPLDFYDAFAKLTFIGSGGQTRYSVQTFQSGDRMQLDDPTAPRYRWKNSAFGFVGSGLLDDRLYVFALASGSTFHGTREVPVGGSETPATSDVSDFTARMHATLYTDTRTLYFFGFEFNFPTLAYSLINNTGSPVSMTSTIADISAWFRTQFDVGRFQFDGGVHFDMGELFRGSTVMWFQPRLNMSYALFEDWRLKASVGRFSQHLVTVNNEDDLITLFDAWIAVPDDLEAERSDHIVLGIGGSLAAQWGLDVQAYHKTLGSLVTYNAGKLVASDPDYISGSGRASGVEASVRFAHPDLDLMGAYGLSSTSLSQPGISYPPRYDRRHSVKLLAVLHAAASLDLSARWDYGSGLPFTPSVASYNRPTFGDLLRDPSSPELGERYLALGPKNSFRLPDYHRLDLAATFRQRLGPFVVGFGVSVTNAYDRKNIFYFDRRNGRRVNSLSFFPSASLTLEFP